MTLTGTITAVTFTKDQWLWKQDVNVCIQLGVENQVILRAEVEKMKWMGTKNEKNDKESLVLGLTHITDNVGL